MTNSKLNDKIWLTSKSRKRAEERCRTYERHWSFVLVLGSFLLSGIALFDDRFPLNTPTQQLSISLSILLIFTSMVIAGFKFGELAAMHRQCYLRLDKLAASASPDDERSLEYHSILEGYPNHSPLDYHKLVIDETFLTGKKLFNPDGSKLTWSFVMLLNVVRHYLMLLVLPGTLIVLLIVGARQVLLW